MAVDPANARLISRGSRSCTHRSRGVQSVSSPVQSTASAVGTSAIDWMGTCRIGAGSTLRVMNTLAVLLSKAEISALAEAAIAALISGASFRVDRTIRMIPFLSSAMRQYVVPATVWAMESAE